MAGGWLDNTPCLGSVANSLLTICNYMWGGDSSNGTTSGTGELNLSKESDFTFFVIS